MATSPAEVGALSLLAKQASNNGVSGLKLLSQKDVHLLEPNVSCSQALYVPETCIFDVSSFVSSLYNDCETNNISSVFNCNFLAAQKEKNGIFIVSTNQGDLATKYLVNCAGLCAPSVAKHVKEYPAEMVPKMYFAKGNYFKLNGLRKPFNRLIYPLPGQGGLGVHATLDMNGGTRFGPDVEWLQSGNVEDPYLFTTPPNEQENPQTYDVRPSRGDCFYPEVRKYFPSLADGSLSPDYSGIRPKLRGPTWCMPQHHVNGRADEEGFPRDVNDFVIEDARHHGVEGLVNLFGIESPGLTSSLSIGEYVANTIIYNCCGVAT